MIKRPLNSQFSDHVKSGRKFTTIRDKPWPTDRPIMLYNWSGLPYRSKHVDVAPIKVSGFWTIHITRTDNDKMGYGYGMECGIPLWKTEGFESKEAMDAWFRPLVKKNATITKTLMRFSLVNTN
ncbi:hypothetical protein QEH52_01770 [Coraliomargarita sp. SDUM461003]|uniref:Uncharacterized protein n=1 Tax=Thalassobacterium maritimum TaxID=3041265 RepID=A0ABU1APX5_9BACT|nr:hypothetical protein [Coraliomargarita sp. SDUM461003]MDQ8206220.1 hypothetical protein [Coraliomargarita sp. SDUM461003]